MTDLLEQRLAEAGRRWQAAQPPAPQVPFDRLDERLPERRTRRRWLAAAVAVVAVAGGLVAAASVGRHDGSTPPTSGRGTVHVVGPVEGVVPWRDLPATHPHVRHRVDGHIVTPFDRVIAAGEIHGRLHAGDTLVFVAVLEASQTVTLDPCPDYAIAFGTHGYYPGALNCAQVPFRDGRGRPILPAGEKVRFEMRVTVPEVRGPQKVLWTLDGPQQLPGFYGIVRVG